MNAQQTIAELAGMGGIQLALGRRSADMQGLAAEIRDGLRQPIDFPPARQFTIPGDRIVLAVHPSIPRIESVLTPIIDELCNDGRELDDVLLLFADRESAQRYRENLPGNHRSISITVHEGTGDDALVLLGADEHHHALLVNRQIFDADVVIPVIRAKGPGETSATSLLRDFFDSQTQARWRASDSTGDFEYGIRVGELAGAFVVVEVVVGPGDFPYAVVVGRSGATATQVESQTSHAWRWLPVEQADIVVVGLNDARDQPSWQAIRDALVASDRFGEKPPFILIADIDQPLPKAWRDVFQSGRQGDSVGADQPLRDVVADRDVYLCSPLPPDEVAAMGLKPLEGTRAIAGLLAKYLHPVLARDPQHLVHGDVGAEAAPANSSKKPRKAGLRRSKAHRNS